MAAWSRTQTVVAMSSAEAEYVAMTVAATEAQWAAHFLGEIGVPVGSPTVFTDSSAAKDMCRKKRFAR